MADANSQSGWGGFIGGAAGGLVNYFGNQATTNAAVGGQQNAINTQTGLQGQLSDIYGTQRGLGVGADVSLANQLGIGGGAPNYAAFNNSPGYQFALSQGNQAIDRTAAANGSLYTPNTLAMLSQYNTGYASQNYNNYIGQLMQSAGLGASGNAGLASGIAGVGNNISQLQQNQGNTRASGAADTTGIASNLLSKIPWGQVASGAGNWFNGSNSSSGAGNYFGSDYGTGASGTPDASSTQTWNGDNSGDPSGWAGWGGDSSNP